MASFRTRSIPSFHAPKPGVAKPERMPALKLPTMKTGGTPRLSAPSLPRAAGGGGGARVRSTPMQSRIVYAASSTGSGALTGPNPGYRRQHDQAL